MPVSEIDALLDETVENSIEGVLDEVAGIRRALPLPRVPFAEYVAATKRLTLDRWQIDLCERLERAFWFAQSRNFKFPIVAVGTGPAYVTAPSGLKIDAADFQAKRDTGTRAAIHAFPQCGKSIVISQAYPSWILGYDPVHRFRLATYNISHSKSFSETILYTLRSVEHLRFFRDPAGHVPLIANTAKWYTNARRVVNDGQSSFTSLGLQSGFVGTGADTLLCDDPYKNVEEALSEVIRNKTWRFYTDTAEPRMNEGSNVFIMFHRYHQDDMGGRAIATGQFELWRYAAEADGDYVDDEGDSHPCFPLYRKVGEYLTPRFPESFYLRQKFGGMGEVKAGGRPTSVWWAQFQGRPTALGGNMFDVTRLRTMLPTEVPPILYRVRAWDNAATEGGGAFTAGPLMGIDSSENIYIFGMEREQVGTAGRFELQETTAHNDGKLVQIHIPVDPGSAGKDVAFDFEQALSVQGFNVIAERVSGSKEMRATPWSRAVNSGRAVLVLNPDGSVPTWHKPFINEAQYFPGSTYKDQIDSSSDGFSHLMRLYRRGLVVKGSGRHNLVEWSAFSKNHGKKIQDHWEVSVGVRLASDASRLSGYCIMARAAENAKLGEAVFVVAARRMHADGLESLLASVKDDLQRYCAKGVEHPGVVWVRSEKDAVQVASEKMGFSLRPFTDEITAGILELNWYFDAVPSRPNPFYGARVPASHLYLLVADKQYDAVVDDEGLLSMRQELESWSYNDKGLPQAFNGITLDCGRMTVYNFALTATALTAKERVQAKMPAHLREPELLKTIGTPDFVDNYWAAQHLEKILTAEDTAKTKGAFSLGPRPVQRRYRRGK